MYDVFLRLDCPVCGYLGAPHNTSNPMWSAATFECRRCRSLLVARNWMTFSAAYGFLASVAGGLVSWAIYLTGTDMHPVLALSVAFALVVPVAWASLRYMSRRYLKWAAVRRNA